MEQTKEMKYYNANKEKVAIQRKEKRLGRPMTSDELNEFLKKPKSNTIYINQGNENMLEFLKTQEFNGVRTKETYISTFHRINTLVDGKDIKTLIENQELLPIIKSSTYSTATKKDMLIFAFRIQMQLGNEFSKKIIEEKDRYYFDLLDEMDNELLCRNQKVIPTFEEYISKVKDHFGAESKMYLLARLYEEFALRDDFQLIITFTTPKDTDNNYIKINKSNHRLIINKFKTEKKYDPVKSLISKNLSTLLTEYIEREKLKEADYLFGNQTLSSYISTENKKIGIDGGVCLFRQMKITQIHNDPKMKRYDKVKLAEKMKHTYNIQKHYLRKNMSV